jgi:hypothetical protein
MRRDPTVVDLHHSDIITYALTRLASQYAREKIDILRDLRNYKAAESSMMPLRLPGQDLTGVQPTQPHNPSASTQGKARTAH